MLRAKDAHMEKMERLRPLTEPHIANLEQVIGILRRDLAQVVDEREAMRARLDETARRETAVAAEIAALKQSRTWRIAQAIDRLLAPVRGSPQSARGDSDESAEDTERIL